MNLDNLFQQRAAATTMQFIALRDIRFESSIPNRAINWDYVEQLRMGKVNQLPAIDVMFLSNSREFELLDGQHRYWAIVNAIAVARPRLFPPGPDDEEAWARHYRACISQVDDTIQARIWPEMTGRDVMMFRFWRNRNHGLGASDVERKAMARMLKDLDPSMTIAAIAHEIGRSTQFVSRALNEPFKQERATAPDGFQVTRRFCNLVEKAYSDGFMMRAQINTRVEWLKDDPEFAKAYAGIARQMLKDLEAARK